MYVYEGKPVATYEQLVPVLGAKNNKQLANTYDRNKQQFSEGQDIVIMKGCRLRQFCSDNQLGKISILHLFTKDGAYKLAKFRKLDNSRINEVYGVTEEKTATDDVKPEEPSLNQGTKKANASYSHFDIIDGYIKFCRKANIPTDTLLVEQHELIERQKDLIEKQKDLIERQNERNDKKNEVVKDIADLMIKLKQTSDEAVLKTIELLQY